MIKFFRSIRYKLLTDNKTGKYIKYAIGEIVLVIIGILIALQINEWNGERKELIQLRKNLEYVLVDLEEDKAQLLKLKGERTHAAQFCSDIIDKYIQNKEINYNRTDNSLKNILYELKFNRNLDGFKKVETNELFQSSPYADLRNQINAYESQIDQLVFDEQRLNYFIEENELKMFANGSFIKIYEHMRVSKSYANPSVELSELSWLEQLKDNLPFQAILLRFEDDVNQFLIPHYNKTIAEGEELSKAIEEYLNKNQ